LDPLSTTRNAAEGVPYRSSLPNLNVKVHQRIHFNTSENALKPKPQGLFPAERGETLRRLVFN
jgi:hypothetical protein